MLGCRSLIVELLEWMDEHVGGKRWGTGAVLQTKFRSMIQ